jgi:hypothetical protein
MQSKMQTWGKGDETAPAPRQISKKLVQKAIKPKIEEFFSESFDPPRGFVKNSFELPPSIFNPCASLNAITLKLGWSKFLSNSTVVFPKFVLKSNIKN